MQKSSKYTTATETGLKLQKLNHKNHLGIRAEASWVN